MKMKFLITFVTYLIICSISYADDIGRYQAVDITKSDTSSTDAVFIIDTKEGHMWVWKEWPTIRNVVQGGRIVIYMGKVKPGKKLGDIIDQQQY
jgi:hypothetical protein